ncbi:probable serine/threonine-protein kinase DDB_G0276181 [Oppia nitens]|uniref:probable serine/threonine-protein kinase DDB_G0276181 n=1 Tax=Oppia nitens TaxID=1686743 RepID=UPI0023DA2D1B|nr:probable serine/threonine-protein kinase DDB_G0276181 [Oppia nitens]
MAHYNMAFAGDEFDAMDTSVDAYPEPDTSATPVDDNTSVSSKTGQPFGSFTFIDFCPQYRRKPDSWFFQADYQTFSEVFHQINEWLSDNPKWQVKTAETLIYDSTNGFGQRLPFFAGKQLKRNLRGIRLWLIPRQPHQRNSPQKIGCINVVPRIKITNNNNNNNNNNNINNININNTDDTDKSDILSTDLNLDNIDIDSETQSSPPIDIINESTQSSLLSSKPVYESLDEMLVRVNDLFATKPLEGRILSVETVPIPVESTNWSVNTETSYWSYDYQKNNNTVYILRIYFEYGNPAYERLEIIDFIPKVQIWDTPLAVPVYESFSSLLSRSSQWLRNESQNIRFLSSNTVETPIDYAFNTESIKENLNEDNDSIDSRKMFYINNNNNNNSLVTGGDKPNGVVTNEFSLKFLRLAVAKQQQQEPCPDSSPVILNCKIFVPTKIANPLNTNSPEFESVTSSKRKIEAWLMATGAHVLSAETTVISIPFSSSSIATTVDSCLKSNLSVAGHHLTIYRIYLDGHCLEPPARLLPLNLNDDKNNNNQHDSCIIML